MGEILSFGSEQEEILWGEYFSFALSQDAFDFVQEVRNNPTRYFGTGNETVTIKSCEVAVDHEQKLCVVYVTISMTGFMPHYRGEK